MTVTERLSSLSAETTYPPTPNPSIPSFVKPTASNVGADPGVIPAEAGTQETRACTFSPRTAIAPYARPNHPNYHARLPQSADCHARATMVYWFVKSRQVHAEKETAEGSPMNTYSCTAFARHRCLLALILLAGSAAHAADFAGGTGDPNDPYQIATAAQLTSIGADPTLLDKHYVLLNDLDLDPNLPGGRVFDRAVIGRAGQRLEDFKGHFSGDGHIIRNLVIVSEDNHPVGLFHDVGRGAKIDQLGIENASIDAKHAVGVLAGENAGSITACYATGLVKCFPPPREPGTRDAAEVDEGYEEMMKQLREIYGDRYKQLFDPNQRPQPVHVPATAGGLVGANYGRIESCYAAVAVRTPSEDPNAVDAGGLVGANAGAVFASYAVGPVTEAAGGLVGRDVVLSPPGPSHTGRAYLSFWDTETSGADTSALGTAKTTVQMMARQTYQGWDYGGHWTIKDAEDYPRLSWEQRTGAPIPPFNTYVDGSGRPHDPFRLRTAEQLAKIGRFRATWDKHFVLANDIDMSAIDPNDLAIIGTIYLPFTGTFDGRGHTIANFTYRSPGQHSVGLFGLVGHRRFDQIPRVGLIENVRMQRASVSGRSNVGLLVGQNWGTMRTCHVDGTVIGTRSHIGGLTGFSAGPITSCTSSGSISGDDRVGGLVGSYLGGIATIENCGSSCMVVGRESVGGLAGSASGSIRNSYATGNVRGHSDVGGLVGQAGARLWACYAGGDVTGTEDVGGLAGQSFASIVACYASGTVVGKKRAGGLVGFNFEGIVACYSSGKVTAPEAAGGLVGSRRFRMGDKWGVGTDRLCFWDRQTSGMATSDGGLGKTTAQLMQTATFEGWGIDDVWVLHEGTSYPRLAWQNLPGEPIRDDPQRYAAGTGRPDDPFQIHTIEQLCAIGNHPGDFDAHFILTQDLDAADLDPNTFLPIGCEGLPFLGSFDGQGHTISNLTIARPHEDYVALFGHAGRVDDSIETSPTRLANLHLRQITVHGQSKTGGLVGMFGKGAITDCSVTGRITGEGAVGGLAGVSYGNVTRCTANAELTAGSHAGVLIGNNAGTVESCAATGTLTGRNRLGGLIGVNADASRERRDSDDVHADARVSRSRADCTVTGENSIGGLIGYCGGDSWIESCYARGTVKGQESVGGLLGAFARTNITNSYAATVVSGTERTGGFIGRNYDHTRRSRKDYVPGVISACFWDATLSGLDRAVGDSPDPTGLTALPTAQMQTPTPFRNAAWNFDKTWNIPPDQNYPRLHWEDQ